MTNRKNWCCALSIGPQVINSQSLAALAEAGIHEIELSSGRLLPFEGEFNFVSRAREHAALAKAAGVNITCRSFPLPSWILHTGMQKSANS